MRNINIQSTKTCISVEIVTGFDSVSLSLPFSLIPEQLASQIAVSLAQIPDAYRFENKDIK